MTDRSGFAAAGGSTGAGSGAGAGGGAAAGLGGGQVTSPSIHHRGAANHLVLHVHYQLTVALRAHVVEQVPQIVSVQLARLGGKAARQNPCSR